jgi:hypothetical protein
MEAASTSETLVNFYQTTLQNNPEDSHLETTVVQTELELEWKHEIVIKFCAVPRSQVLLLHEWMY